MYAQLKTRDVNQDVLNKLLIEGWSRQSVLSYLMDDTEGYGYGKSYAYELIRVANKTMNEMIRETAVNAFNFQLTRLETLYQRAIRKQNDTLALSILKEVNNILGLHRETINHTGEVKVIKTKWGDESDFGDSFDL